jgi:hypothetical protein
LNAECGIKRRQILSHLSLIYSAFRLPHSEFKVSAGVELDLARADALQVGQ